jgi:hypothetical protein
MNDQTGSSKAEQPNVLRRRLAKGAVAAPVVLASLASKPVLAHFNGVGGVPWVCTLSGQLSGNMSGHTIESCDEGTTTRAGLTSDFSAGGLGANTIKQLFPSVGEDLFFRFDAAPNALTLQSGPGTSVATVYQVLTTNTGSLSDEDYAQRALVILLNARGLTDNSLYPLTEGQAIKLFIAACKKVNFVDTNPDINWNYGQVKAYIDLLYDGVL